MGEYFDIVCHDCKKVLNAGGKLREVALNVDLAARVGWFATLHAGHQIELCGDERTGTLRTESRADYTPELLTDDEDIRHAMDKLNQMRAASPLSPPATPPVTEGGKRECATCAEVFRMLTSASSDTESQFVRRLATLWGISPPELTTNGEITRRSVRELYRAVLSTHDMDAVSSALGEAMNEADKWLGVAPASPATLPSTSDATAATTAAAKRIELEHAAMEKFCTRYDGGMMRNSEGVLCWEATGEAIVAAVSASTAESETQEAHDAELT